jgi:hypothetical protein
MAFKPGVIPGDESVQKSFIKKMKEKLDEKKIRYEHQGDTGQPSANDLKAFFGLFTTDYSEALSKLGDYLKWFYLHVDSFQPARATPVWGGRTAEEQVYTLPDWSQIAGASIDGVCRIVDCKAMTFMASELLTAGGWTRKGYHIYYFKKKAQQRWPWHIAVSMGFAATKDNTAQTYVIGHQDVSNTTVYQEGQSSYEKLGYFDAVCYVEAPQSTPALAYALAVQGRDTGLEEEKEEEKRKKAGKGKQAEAPRFNDRTGGQYPPRRPASNFV